MRTRTRPLLRLLSLCLALAGLGCEPAVDEEREQRARALREMFDVLGLPASAEQWTRLAVGNMVQFKEAFDADTLEAVREAAAESYAPGLLLDEMVEHYVDHYDPDAVHEIITYFRSPAGVEVVKAARFAGVDSLQSLDGFLAKLADQPPSAERIALARRLMTATRQSEQAVLTMVSLSKTNLIAVLPLLPGAAVDAELLKQREAKLRSDLLKRTADQSEIASLYAFQDFSGEALRDYVEFAESGYYAWYVQELGPSVNRALAAAGGRLGDRVETLASARQSGP